MSKSYDNTIPLFADPKTLRKLVRRITTDSTPVEEPKDADASAVFAIYRQFASADDQERIRARLARRRHGLGRDEGHRLRGAGRAARGPARALRRPDGRPGRARTRSSPPGPSAPASAPTALLASVRDAIGIA